MQLIHSIIDAEKRKKEKKKRDIFGYINRFPCLYKIMDNVI
jgi:hypothetical protein